MDGDKKEGFSFETLKSRIRALVRDTAEEAVLGDRWLVKRDKLGGLEEPSPLRDGF